MAVDFLALEPKRKVKRRDGGVVTFMVTAGKSIPGPHKYGCSDGLWRIRNGMIHSNGVEHKFDIVEVV